jgi:hypothetical protein
VRDGLDCPNQPISDQEPTPPLATAQAHSIAVMLLASASGSHKGKEGRRRRQRTGRSTSYQQAKP